MNVWLLALGAILLGEKLWKHISVVQFFQRPQPPAPAEAELVSILQPILSGDPTLHESLEHNLRMQDRHPREYVWLVDSDDGEAQSICRSLMDDYPHRRIQLIISPPPAGDANPKTLKLIEGLRHARGSVIAVLDDDTRLPERGLEQCLPYLQQPGVGLAFGLPYYVSFQNLWSSLIAYFVNSNSLLTYIPYLSLTQPFTINGMFYVMRRQVLDSIGGFAGLEGILADDFAIARRVREHGYALAQTPLRHAISTYVTGPGHYFSLMRRWFVFPRESLMRYLSWQERLVLYGLNFIPALVPLCLLGALILHASVGLAAYSALYFAYSYAVFAHLNAVFLRGASPWRRSWLIPIIQVIFPLELIFALLSPPKIRWRGHIIQAKAGGGLQFMRYRSQGSSSAQAIPGQNPADDKQPTI